MPSNKKNDLIIKVCSLLFCCQLSTLGLLRQTPTYSLWEQEILSYPVLSQWMARILSVIVVFAAVYLAFKQWRFLKAKTLLIISGIMLLIGFLLTFFFSDSFVLYIVGQTFIGFSHAWILICWAEFFTLMQKGQRNRSIAYSALLAAVLFMIMGIVPLALQSILFMIMVVGSFAPLVFISFCNYEWVKQENLLSHNTSSQSDGFGKSLAGSFKTISLEFIILMLCYALLFRIMVFFEFSADYGTSTILWGSLIRIGGMALLLLYLSWKKFEPNTQQIIIPLFFLTAIGLALLSGPENTLGAFSVALVESSWTFFYTLIWLILLEIGDSKRYTSLQIFALGWGILNTLLLLAAPLAYLLTVQVSTGVLSLTALFLVILYTLLVGLLLFRRRNQTESQARKGTSSDTESKAWESQREDLLKQIAEEHNLTRRETEVFILLAQGYSLPSIEEHFTLSHSTVKGHARHIYEKLNVSGKQALIKYINSQYADKG